MPRNRKPPQLIWPRKQRIPMHAYPTDSDEETVKLREAMDLDYERRAIDGFADAIRTFAPNYQVAHLHGWNGPGWYVWSTDYPDEGSTCLTGPDDIADHRELVRIARYIVHCELFSDVD